MSRPLADREDTFKGYNQTGSAIASARLVNAGAWVDALNAPSLTKAIASGTNQLADGILITQHGADLADGRMGRVYLEYVLENTNTLGRTVGDPVYLDPTTPGAWTFTRPSTSGQDVQVVGKVLTVSASAGRILFAFTPGLGNGLAGGISSLLLDDKPLHNPGVAATGWIRISAAVTDGDRISINGRIYEFDTAAPPGTIGAGANVRVGVSGGGGDQANTAAGCEAALVAAINGDASAVVYAVGLGGAGYVGLVAKVVGTTGNYALSDTVDAGSVLTVSAATLTGGLAEGAQTVVQRAYVMTAADVTLLASSIGTAEIVVTSFPSTTQPTLVHIGAISAAGAEVDLAGATFTLRQASTGFWVLCYAENALGAILSAGDRITVALQAND